MAKAFIVRCDIDAPPADVMDTATQPDRWSEWLAPIRHVGGPRPLPVETPFVIELLDGSNQTLSIGMDEEMAQSPSLSIRIHEGPIDIVHRYVFAPARGGTSATHTASATLRGPIALFGPIYRQLGLRGERRQLARLEAVVLSERR